MLAEESGQAAVGGNGHGQPGLFYADPLQVSHPGPGEEKYFPSALSKPEAPIHLIEKHGKSYVVHRPYLIDGCFANHQASPHRLIHLPPALVVKTAHPPGAENRVAGEKPGQAGELPAGRGNSLQEG